MKAKTMRRTWPVVLVSACWVGIMGCGPTVELKASSAGRGGDAGSGGSTSGAGGASGATTPGVGGGDGSGGGVPLVGTKYDAPLGFYDVVWDTKRDRVFLSTGADGLVRVLDLKTSAWTSIKLGHRTEHMYFDAALDQVLVSVAVKDHSYTWFEEDQTGYLGVINAATLEAGKLLLLPFDPWAIVSNGAGYAYISGASGQGTHMLVVNLATGTTVLAGKGMEMGTSLQLHPDKTHVYASTGQIQRFVVDGETVHSPYPGNTGGDNHYVFGALRIHPAGTTMYMGSGSVFLATSSPDTDMTWSDTIGVFWRDLAFRPDGKLAYLVPDQNLGLMDGVYKPLLYTLDTTSFAIVATHKLGAPAERVLASDAGLVLVRRTLGGDPKAEVEVVSYGAL